MKNLQKTTFCSDRVPNIGYLDFRNKFKYNKIPGRIKQGYHGEQGCDTECHPSWDQMSRDKKGED